MGKIKKILKGIVIAFLTYMVLYMSIGGLMPKSETHLEYSELTNNKIKLQEELDGFTEEKISELSAKIKSEKEKEL